MCGFDLIRCWYVEIVCLIVAKKGTSEARTRRLVMKWTGLFSRLSSCVVDWAECVSVVCRLLRAAFRPNPF